LLGKHFFGFDYIPCTYKPIKSSSMYLRVLLASLAGTAWNFFGGWVIYGMLLMDYYQSHTIVYDGLAKEDPDMVWLIISCFAPALLIAIMEDRTGKSSLIGGAITGFTIGFLLQLTFTGSMFAFFNLHDSTAVLAVDVVTGALYYAVTGAIAGGILGFKKA
jgi:Na+/proline symporter